MMCLLLMTAGIAAAEETSFESSVSRQSRDDAWWTGPLLASSAATLPQGHFLIEPYLYDSIVYGRFDASGTRHSAPRVHNFGSQTYLLYGLMDRVTVGLIPRFGFSEVSEGQSSSRVGVGDITFQAQYRLTQFQEGGWLPTTSVVLGETLPTGKYDRLGSHPADGLGGGAYITTLSVFSQYFLWLPTGRILRTRLDLSYSLPSDADVKDVSVYGTDAGFRGRARLGSSFVADSSWEYSLTRNWVLALDVIYQHDGNTRVRGFGSQQPGALTPASVEENSGSSRTLGFAPAIEYNWNSRLGVIVGAKLTAIGRNANATVIPVAAINFVH
jgi:hypothetical protein